MSQNSVSDIEIFCGYSEKRNIHFWFYVSISVPQMFFYNVNMLPSELFDESISLRVGR